jgi:hypothetical protein
MKVDKSGDSSLDGLVAGAKIKLPTIKLLIEQKQINYMDWNFIVGYILGFISCAVHAVWLLKERKHEEKE